MFFYLSKIFYFFINPINLVFIALLLGVFLLWIKKVKMGRNLLTLSAIFALLVTVFPIENIIRTHLENRFPVPVSLPEHIDGIIILGGAVHPGLSNDRKQLILQGNSERLFNFARLAKKFPTARLVYTGGSNSLTEQHLKEAHFATAAFNELGIQKGRILYEDQSRNTIENALFSKELASPQPGENWILITSAQHMPRAVGCFRKANWTVIPYPVDYSKMTEVSLSASIDFARRSSSLSYGLHEVIGLFTYWLTDKTDSLYPAPASH